MITLLIAEGGNGLEIPCMIFKSLQEAQEKLQKLFGVNIDTSFRVEEENINTEDDYQTFFRIFDTRSLKGITRNYYGGRLSFEDCLVGKRVPVKELFKGYYSGCGGVGSFYLQEIQEDEFEKPLVGWDLD